MLTACYVRYHPSNYVVLEYTKSTARVDTLTSALSNGIRSLARRATPWVVRRSQVGRSTTESHTTGAGELRVLLIAPPPPPTCYYCY